MNSVQESTNLDVWMPIYCAASSLSYSPATAFDIPIPCATPVPRAGKWQAS
jgi:hypothetical protein